MVNVPIRRVVQQLIMIDLCLIDIDINLFIASVVGDRDFVRASVDALELQIHA